MAALIDKTQAKRHSLGDWLRLHELDHAACLHLLETIGRESANIPVHRENPDQQPLSLNHEGVWTEVVSSMRRFLPAHQTIINDTFQGAKKIAITGQRKSQRALTVDNGPGQYPTIMYNYSGEVSDLFVVAHEFGHALQIRASEGRFMPPIMRETCAFLAEGALLFFRSYDNPGIGEKLLRHWHKSNRRYFQNLAVKFRLSLENSAQTYQYGWNYPIARLLAVRLLAGFSPDLVWNVFQGDFSTKRLVDQLAI